RAKPETEQEQRATHGQVATLANTLEQFTHELDRVRVARGFVFSIAFYARKAQGKSSGISGALLQPVEGNLDHELGADSHQPLIRRRWLYRQLLEFRGLPREHRVSETLEGFAEHHESARFRIASPEVQVAEPTLASPAPPFGRQHHQIERRSGF